MNDDYNSIITLYNNYYSLEDISEKVNKIMLENGKLEDFTVSE